MCATTTQSNTICYMLTAVFRPKISIYLNNNLVGKKLIPQNAVSCVPNELQLHGNMAATGNDKKPHAQEIAILLNQIGDEGLGVYNTFEFENEGDNEKYEVSLQKFNEYSSPTKILVFEQYKFCKRDQRESVTFDQLSTESKKLAAHCEFK